MTDHLEHSNRDLPVGTLTLLFADIEGSTQLLRQLGERYAQVQLEYLHLLRTTLQRWNGFEVDIQGDAYFAVFPRAIDAVLAVVELRRDLATHLWSEDITISARIGLHTGTPERTPIGYAGLDVHYAARLMHVASGGQILLSQTTYELVKHRLPEKIDVLDLGTFSLRDFPDPRHIFQLSLSELPADFPPLHTIENRFESLPVQLSTLIGREKEIAAVCEILQRKEVRLLTLTGTGGIGKTRLGIEVAIRELETFADGAVFVPLAPIIHPRLVLPTIKHVLGLHQPQRAQRSQHLEDLKEFLRDKHVLLVLDNFEQVLSAASDLTELLISCPKIKLLVTSRSVLRIQGEYEYLVPPLSLPRWTHLPDIEALSQFASVALFVERAQQIKPDLALTKANMQAIASICVYLDGLPLAIELAAARVNLLPPPALFRQLTQTQRTEVLTGGLRDVPERHQTLRHTLDWSYQLLEEEEQKVFRLLSVFVEGCTLEAIISVAQVVIGKVIPMLEILSSLIDKSLLYQVEQEGEEAHFMMLETIREYGMGCLRDNGEEEIAWQALAAYYLSLAEQAELQYAGPEQAAWLQRLEKEHENIRAVLQWSLEYGHTHHDMTLALQLGTTLRNFWVIRGPFREGRVFLERALETREGVEVSILARALFAAENLAFVQGDFHTAEKFGQESLKLFRELNDRPGMAFALYGLAWLAKDDITIDIALTREALALFQEIGNSEFVAWSIYTLAYLDCLRGEYSSAFSLIEESLALHSEMGNTRGIAHSLLTRVQLHIFSKGNLAIADSCLDECLPLLKALDDQDGLAYAGLLRGQLALLRGDISQARVLIEESLTRYKKMGSQQGIVQSLYQSGRAAIAGGDESGACNYYRDGLAVARELNMNELIAACLEGLAGVAGMQEKYAWAVSLWATADALREAVHIPIPFVDRADYERSVANARMHLGEHMFDELWSQGRTITPEQAISLQEQEVESPVAGVLPSGTHPAGLTEREVQVLRLVARGLTNSEIANELHLSEKTIAHHMTHIFNKTSSENRAAAVAFAFRHGLA